MTHFPAAAVIALGTAGLAACGPGAAPGARREPPPLLAASLPAGAAFALPQPSPIAQLLPLEAPPLPEPAEPAPTAMESPRSACNEQAAQAFLMRSSYAFQLGLSRDETQARKRLHRKAIEYRTRRYGYVEGFGDAAWNRRAPRDYAGVATFFGVRVRMNARVLAALACVETAIEDACGDTPYAPQRLDGLRTKNTFHDNEVSNHLYGIAIDVDPDRNACCGCVAPVRDVPICKRPASTPFDHADIPRCWVDAFERFGFYWLGHDALEDTMHFEFLGDPDKIARR